MRFVAEVSYGPPWRSAQRWTERFESNEGVHAIARDIAEWRRDSILPSELYDLPPPPLGIQLLVDGRTETILSSTFHVFLMRELDRVFEEELAKRNRKRLLGGAL